jgi:hypothetical protein
MYRVQNARGVTHRGNAASWQKRCARKTTCTPLLQRKYPLNYLSTFNADRTIFKQGPLYNQLYLERGIGLSLIALRAVDKWLRLIDRRPIRKAIPLTWFGALARLVRYISNCCVLFRTSSAEFHGLYDVELVLDIILIGIKIKP